MRKQPLEKIELNIALVPDEEFERHLTDLSQWFALRYPAIVQLGGSARLRLAMAAHLTLLQTAVPLRRLQKVGERVETLAERWSPFTVESTSLAYNPTEGSLEKPFRITPELVAAQNAAIADVNPLRDGLLLERDPAGNDLGTFMETPGELADMLARCGYWEAGKFFRPHVTLNWFELDTMFDLVALEQQLIDWFMTGGTFNGVAIYSLGPYGTCPQRLAYFPLKGKAA